MSRRLTLLALAFAAALPLGLPAAAQDAYMTRIEPRPFYGATVTIESGVRVFRPLPTTRHVIVNSDMVRREILEQKVKPVIIAFLDERGLQLAEEKTVFTHIEQRKFTAVVQSPVWTLEIFSSTASQRRASRRFQERNTSSA